MVIFQTQNLTDLLLFFLGLSCYHIQHVDEPCRRRTPPSVYSGVIRRDIVI